MLRLDCNCLSFDSASFVYCQSDDCHWLCVGRPAGKLAQVFLYQVFSFSSCGCAPWRVVKSHDFASKRHDSTGPFLVVSWQPAAVVAVTLASAPIRLCRTRVDFRLSPLLFVVDLQRIVQTLRRAAVV